MVCVALAGSASAQVLTSTQIVPFDYDPGVGIANPEFQLFDTMGGTRELVGVTLSYDQTISFTVQAEQNSPVQIEEGVFFADVSYISLHQLGVADDGGGDDDDDNNSNIPFLGPGAHFITISPAFGASDGYNGSGPDTYVESTSSGAFNYTANYNPVDNPSFIDVFTGQGTLTTVFGGFLELFGGYNSDPGFPDVDPNNPPQGPFFPFQDPFYGVFVDAVDMRHQGTITATFEYELVPAPASVSLASLAALGLTRRRR